MARYEKMRAEELKEFLSKQIVNLQLLKKLLIILIIVVVVSIIGHIIYYFNYLTTLRFDVLTARSKVESAIQLRANLIPVLIESVVSFVEHEDNVFNRAVDARERSILPSPEVMKQLKASIKTSSSQVQIEDLMKKIIAIAEQYPTLTSSVPFQQLMTETAKTETEIYNQRVDYNEKVNVYTTAISMFPGNVYSAVLFNFPFYDYFEGNKHSEWPHFKGKLHSDWPQVELKFEQGRYEKGTNK